MENQKVFFHGLLCLKKHIKYVFGTFSINKVLI